MIARAQRKKHSNLTKHIKCSEHKKHGPPPDLNRSPGAFCGPESDGCSPTLGAAMHCPLCFMFGKAMVISEAMHGQPFREVPRTSGRQPLLVRFRSSSSTPVLIAPSDEDATLTTGRDPLPPSTSSPRYGRLRGGSAIIIDPPPPLRSEAQ